MDGDGVASKPGKRRKTKRDGWSWNGKQRMDADNGCRWSNQPGDWDPCTPQQTPLTNRIELFLHNFGCPRPRSQPSHGARVKDSKKQSNDISGCCCGSFSISFFFFPTSVECVIWSRNVWSLEVTNQVLHQASTCRTKWRRLCTETFVEGLKLPSKKRSKPSCQGLCSFSLGLCFRKKKDRKLCFSQSFRS